MILLIEGGCLTPENKKKQVLPPPYKPVVKAFNFNDSVKIMLNYNLFKNTAKPKAAYIKSIDKITLNLKSRGSVYKSILMNLDTLHSNKPNDKYLDYSLLAEASVFFPQRYQFDLLSLEFVINSDSVIYMLDRPYPDCYSECYVDKSKNLELFPIYEKIDGDNYFFGLAVKRLQIPEKEFLPNSENFRIDISSLKGITLFSTNYNANYAQVIGKVLPAETGKCFLYSYIWNGKNNSSIRMPLGDYQIRYTIPAKPTPYFISFPYRGE